MKAQRFWAVLIGLLVASVFLIVNWMVGVPSSVGRTFFRLQPPVVGATLNVFAAVALIGLVPFAIVFGPKRVKWLIALLLTPVALGALPILLLASFDWLDVLGQGYSKALEPLDRREEDGVRWVVYRTNGGATTSFGILLRRERKIMPGLVAARNIRNWYPADEGRLSRVDSANVRLSVNGQEHVVELNR